MVLTIDELKAQLDSYINTNGIEAITGAVLNDFLENLIDSILAVGSVQSSIGSVAPNNANGKEGDLYIRTGVGLYRKTSGAWVLGIAITKQIIAKSQTDLLDPLSDGNFYLPFLDGSGNAFPANTIPLLIEVNNVQVQTTFDETFTPPRIYGFANNSTQTIKLVII